MNIKELKELIKDIPDEREVLTAAWDAKKYEIVLRTTHRCSNVEHQENQGQFWLSAEGLTIHRIK